VATTATTNGNGAAAAVEQLVALEAAFSGRRFSFRHRPHAKCKELQWQAGRDTLDPITMPNGDCLLLERFELIAWAPTANELIERLAAHE
jgi:hypothetical protein